MPVTGNGGRSGPASRTWSPGRSPATWAVAAPATMSWAERGAVPETIRSGASDALAQPRPVSGSAVVPVSTVPPGSVSATGNDTSPTTRATPGTAATRVASVAG